MRFFTDAETRKYLGIQPGESARGGFEWSGTRWVRSQPGLSTTYYLTQDGRSRYWMARAMVGLLEHFDTCMLWVTLTGVWEENLHLYYRLRQSYGDFRLIDEAPGHLFHRYESADLATFIELCLHNGWDAHVLPNLNYASAFISHDGAIDWFTDRPDHLAEIQKAFPPKSPHAEIPTGAPVQSVPPPPA